MAIPCVSVISSNGPTLKAAAGTNGTMSGSWPVDGALDSVRWGEKTFCGGKSRGGRGGVGVEGGA